MPIHFEDVTGSIERPPAAGGEAQRATAPAADEDFEARLEAALRLMAERAARLTSD